MNRPSMSISVGWITAIVSLLTVSADVVAPKAATRDLFIQNISVADPSRPKILTNQSILIQDGVIVAMGNRDAMKAPRGADKFDGTGKFLIPGLADMHVHLGEHSEVYNTLLVANGVTRVRDMGGDIWRTHDIQQRIASGDLVGPDMTAAGPILENRRWLSIVRRNEPLDHRIPIGSVSEVRDVLDIVAPLGIDFVKIRNAPAPPIYSALAKEAALRGMKLVGHEPLVVGLADAFKIGQRSIEHVPWISLTRPGRDPSADDINAIVKTALAEGVYLTPTIVAMQARLASTDELRVRLAATDANSLMKYIAADHLDNWKHTLDMRDTETADLPWPSMIEKTIEYLRVFHKAGVPIMTGTDFGVILVYPG